MRISTVSMQQQGVNAMMDKQVDLSKTEMQLATGGKVLRPSDNPVNSAMIVNLKESIAMSEQHLRNADMANASLAFEESTLSGVNDNIQRARELMIQGLNDTNSPESRKAIAMELEQIREAIFNLGNTRDEKGEYVFAGTASPTAPGPFKSVDPQNEAVTFDGNDAQRQIQLGIGQRTVIRDSGVDIFGDLNSGAGDDIFSTLGNMVEWLNPADPANPQVSSADGLLGNLDAGLDRIHSVQSKIGARMNMIERNSDVERGFMDKMKESLSAVNDIDYAETISQFNIEQIGMQAAQQAYTKIQGMSLFDYIR